MKLKKALIASCCLVGSLISIAGDLFTYEFDDVVLTPTEVTNLVIDIGVDSNVVSMVAAYTVSNTVAPVALTGSYTDLVGTPAFPTNVIRDIVYDIITNEFGLTAQ